MPINALHAASLPPETLQRLLTEHLRLEETRRSRRVLVPLCVALAVALYFFGIRGRDEPFSAAALTVVACLLPAVALSISELRAGRRLNRHLREAHTRR